jgi:phage baseplate assembly protein V
VSALVHRIQMLVGRAVLAAVKEDAQMREVQVELLADETQDAVEHFEPYGFTSRAKAGAEAVMLSVGGLRGHGLVICIADRRYRLQVLEEGEAAFHDDQGQVVHLKRDGIVVHGKKLTFESEGDISFDCEKFTVTASDTVALDSDEVTIGTGATLQAARKTDTISGGAINGGSTKVKIA